VGLHVFPPGATRAKRGRLSKAGFATKQAAIEAEALRRIEEQKKRDITQAGAIVVAALPKTLSMLIDEVFRQHVDQKLAPKT